MKFFTLCLFVFLRSIYTFAQPPTTVFQIDVKKPEAFSVFGDSSKVWGVYYMDVKYYYFHLMDHSGREICKEQISREYEKMDERKEFLGGVVKPEGLYFYFRNHSHQLQDHYSSLFLPNGNLPGKHVKNERVSPNRDDEVVKAFVLSNTFYLMTVNKKDRKVNFLKFLDEMNHKIYSFDLDKETMSAINGGNFKVFRNNQIIRFENIIYGKKMFLDPEEKFVLIIESDLIGGPNTTKTIVFNLRNESLQTFTLSETTFSGSSNSWYLDGKIYKFLQASDLLIFYVYDLASKSVVKKYQYRKGDKIELANHNVMTRKEGVTGEKYESVDKDTKIFKHLRNGSPFIQVQKLKNGNLSFMAGTFTGSNSNFYQSGNPASTISTPYGTSTIPGSLSYYTYWLSKEYLTWFNCELDSDYRVGETPPTKPETIEVEEFIEKVSKTENSRNISTFKYQDMIYTVNFLKKEKRIAIVEMK